MVSRNKLLGSGVVFEDEEEKPKEKPKVEFLDSPMWIYNLDFPRGKIIKTKQELEALGENYVDSPKKVCELKEKE